MNHYTYMLIDPTTDMKYIGVRSCKCPILEDKYKGSSKIMTADEKLRSDKMIIKTFDTRQEAMEHEIELHDKYDVGVNHKFYNGCKATSTKFDVSGTKREPFTAEHNAQLTGRQPGTGNANYKRATVYEWEHKDGRKFTGTIIELITFIENPNATASSFYKIFKGKLLYANGWRVFKNVDSNIITSDFKCSGKLPITASAREAMSKAQKSRDRIFDGSVYKWVDYSGNIFVGTVYEAAAYAQKDLNKFRACMAGTRNFGSGYRIIENMTTGCVTTDLNFGRGIKVEITEI